MNDSHVEAFNTTLGHAVDPAEAVADGLQRLLCCHRRQLGLGRPEMLFARLSALATGALDVGLGRQLSLIRRFARS